MLLLQIYAVINKLLNPESIIPPHEIDGIPVCYVDSINEELNKRYKLDFDHKEPEAYEIISFLNAVFGGYTDSQICSEAIRIEDIPEEVIDILWPENKEEKCDALFMSIYSKCHQTEKKKASPMLLGKSVSYFIHGTPIPQQFHPNHPFVLLSIYEIFFILIQKIQKAASENRKLPFGKGKNLFQ